MAASMLDVFSYFLYIKYPRLFFLLFFWPNNLRLSFPLRNNCYRSESKLWRQHRCGCRRRCRRRRRHHRNPCMQRARNVQKEYANRPKQKKRKKGNEEKVSCSARNNEKRRLVLSLCALKDVWIWVISSSFFLQFTPTRTQWNITCRQQACHLTDHTTRYLRTWYKYKEYLATSMLASSCMHASIH